MIQQSPTERAREVLIRLICAEAPELYPDGVRDAIENDMDVVSSRPSRVVRAMIEFASQAAQPAEADGVERNRFVVAGHAAAALAATPKAPATDAGEVEPVAWQWRHPRWTGGEWYITHNSLRDSRGAEYRPLYALATPPAPNDDLRAALAAMLREFDADEFGSEGQMQVCAKARAALASTQPSPAPNDNLRAAWEAGRDAALKEVADYARSCRHLVSPIFVPAIEGIAATLQAPAALKENRRG